MRGRKSSHGATPCTGVIWAALVLLRGRHNWGHGSEKKGSNPPFKYHGEREGTPPGEILNYLGRENLFPILWGEKEGKFTMNKSAL